mgnify:FL=1
MDKTKSKKLPDANIRFEIGTTDELGAINGSAGLQESERGKFGEDNRKLDERVGSTLDYEDYNVIYGESGRRPIEGNFPPFFSFSFFFCF